MYTNDKFHEQYSECAVVEVEGTGIYLEGCMTKSQD